MLEQQLLCCSEHFSRGSSVVNSQFGGGIGVTGGLARNHLCFMKRCRSVVLGPLLD